MLRARTIAWYCAVEIYSAKPLAATKSACVENAFAAASVAAPLVDTASLYDVYDARLCSVSAGQNNQSWCVRILQVPSDRPECDAARGHV